MANPTQPPQGGRRRDRRETSYTPPAPIPPNEGHREKRTSASKPSPQPPQSKIPRNSPRSNLAKQPPLDPRTAGFDVEKMRRALGEIESLAQDNLQETLREERGSGISPVKVWVGVGGCLLFLVFVLYIVFR